MLLVSVLQLLLIVFINTFKLLLVCIKVILNSLKKIIPLIFMFLLERLIPWLLFFQLLSGFLLEPIKFSILVISYFLKLLIKGTFRILHFIPELLDQVIFRLNSVSPDKTKLVHIHMHLALTHNLLFLLFIISLCHIGWTDACEHLHVERLVYPCNYLLHLLDEDGAVEWRADQTGLVSGNCERSDATFVDEVFHVFGTL